MKSFFSILTTIAAVAVAVPPPAPQPGQPSPSAIPGSNTTVSPPSSQPSGPQAGTNKDSQFGLMTIHSGNIDVHQRPVKVDTEGFLNLDTGVDFSGHLVVGPNLITDSVDKSKYLIISEDHHLTLSTTKSLANTTQDWTTNGTLRWNGQSYGLVCPNEGNKIIWADEGFSCDGGIGVELMVATKAV